MSKFGLNLNSTTKSENLPSSSLKTDPPEAFPNSDQFSSTLKTDGLNSTSKRDSLNLTMKSVKSGSSGHSAVKVIVRPRPLSVFEMTRGGVVCTKVPNDNIIEIDVYFFQF
jgi:hypothetical protein